MPIDENDGLERLNCRITLVAMLRLKAAIKTKKFLTASNVLSGEVVSEAIMSALDPAPDEEAIKAERLAEISGGPPPKRSANGRSALAKTA